MNLTELGIKMMALLDEKGIDHSYFDVLSDTIHFRAGIAEMWMRPVQGGLKSITYPFPPMYYFSEDLRHSEYISTSHFQIPEWAAAVGTMRAPIFGS